MASNPDDVSWLPGARLNIAESALNGRDPDAPALIWAIEEAPDTLHTLSLGELRAQAVHFAASLHAAGFSPGKPLLHCWQAGQKSEAEVAPSSQ